MFDSEQTPTRLTNPVHEEAGSEEDTGTFDISPRFSPRVEETFENPATEDIEVETPAAGTEVGTPAGGYEPRNENPGLVPEFEEDEAKPVSVEAGEDLFEHISEALRDIHGGHHAELLRDLFKDVEDLQAQLTWQELGASLESHLKIQLGDDELQQLQGLTKSRLWFGSEKTSISQFLVWWESQCKIDESSDPFQLALAQLAQSNMISPNGDFRGNWDLVQASFLLYIAVVLPYRIGFDDNVKLWSFFFWLDLAIDIYFVCDLFLNFRTAVSYHHTMYVVLSFVNRATDRIRVFVQVVTLEGELMFTKKEVAVSN